MCPNNTEMKPLLLTSKWVKIYALQNYYAFTLDLDCWYPAILQRTPIIPTVFS